MSKFWKTKEFKDLNNKWKKKLDEDGFKDIESKKNEQAPLLPAVRIDTARYRDMEQVLDYHTRAEHYLVDGKFYTEKEKIIWQLHAAGFTASEIGDVMNLGKTAVGYHVKKIRLRMKKALLLDKEKDE